MKLKYLLGFSIGIVGVFFSCQKGDELVSANEEKVVRLTLQGYVMQDTLEFLKEGKVICEAYETIFNIKTPEDRPIVSATGLQVRKKGSTAILDTLSIEEEPFDQVLKIFYDGNSISDNIEITPVSSPDKIGMRFSMQTNNPYVIKGDVDVEIFEKVFTFFPDGTYSETYESLHIIKNVSDEFSEFLELPAITFDDPNVSKSYVFKVYQTGTKSYPFKEGVEFPMGPIDNFYGDLYVVDGESALFQISPYLEDNQFLGYNINDIAVYFQ
ncbi:hypothetical protein RYH73_24205 [Olivibacter sp. CPCC 100613]|uniref:hypothetical protein n=1 Tax=Olivibacter sp. CPCC 100613 TaxID=3079931 RepID=UPI002FFC94DF